MTPRDIFLLTSQETERDLEAFSMSGLQLIFSQFRKNVTTGLFGLEYGITLSFWAEDQKNRTCLENHMKNKGFHCQGQIVVRPIFESVFYFRPVCSSAKCFPQNFYPLGLEMYIFCLENDCEIPGEMQVWSP